MPDTTYTAQTDIVFHTPFGTVVAIPADTVVTSDPTTGPVGLVSITRTIAGEDTVLTVGPPVVSP